MPWPAGVQITRDRRKDGSITFSLRVRISGADDRVALGNTSDGWDEIGAEAARKQLLAKIELGLWAPRKGNARGLYGDKEPTFRETGWRRASATRPSVRRRSRTTNGSSSDTSRHSSASFARPR
jgi:hypothetical protein